MKLVAATAAIMVFVINGTAIAEDAKATAQPKWNELVKMMGKKKDSAEFKAFIKTYKMRSSHSVDE